MWPWETRSFNPRARTGRDYLFLTKNPLRYSFQSTRPHGARHVIAKIEAAMKEFQSTRPHGARPNHLTLYQAREKVSIHAPARGATAG